MGSHRTFADANAKLEGARYSILGVPYDATTSFRPGARFGPDEIRKASYNFETWVNEWDVDLVEVPIHDFGNIGEHHHPEAMLTELESDVRQMVEAGAFPILLGGEHSLAPGAVRVLASKHRALKCLYVDAHLDFRPEYLGTPNSHACAARRIADILGAESIFQFGIRSIERNEYKDAKRMGLRWAYARDIHKKGMEWAIHEAEKALGSKGPLYLSIDMDGHDPSIAPGVGTPEPFGISDHDVKALIDHFAPRLVGADVNETCPPFDNGNTSALAAREVREIIAAREAKLGKRRA
ncbi:MAG TPA: agmatinase [Candidatus Thermoplasmatota archaeon]|nr:agmatinase [Candidatus Thermoplasmatota archaeon]